MSLGNRKDVFIGEFDRQSLAEYAQIPIKFLVKKRLVLSGSAIVGEEAVEEPWIKDYDEHSPPTDLPERFNTDPWGFLAARVGQEMIGGAIFFDIPGYYLVENRSDLVYILDIRVHPDWRGQGVGSLLWTAIESWAVARGAAELRVETQDINVPACRFYQSKGCVLHSVDENAYRPLLDEVQLIWSKPLSTTSAPTDNAA